MRSLWFGALLLPLALTACGGGDDTAKEPAGTVTVTETVPMEDPTEAQESTPAAPLDDSQFEPNVGDRALRIGEPRVGREVTSVVLKAQLGYPSAEFREPQSGNQWFALRFSMCVSKDAETPPEDIFSAGVGDFYLATSDGNQINGSSSYNDFPSPHFPEYVTMNHGECLKGWMAFEVPASIKKAERLIYRPGGQTVAEWLL